MPPFSNFRPPATEMPWWRQAPADQWKQSQMKAQYLDQLQQEMGRWEEYKEYLEPIYRQMYQDPTSQMMLPQMESQMRGQLAPQLEQMRLQQNLSLGQRGLDTRKGGAHEASQLQRKGTQAQAWGDYASGVGQQAEQISKQGLEGLQTLQGQIPGTQAAIKALSPIQSVDIAGQSQTGITQQIASIKQQMRDQQQQSEGGGGKGMLGLGIGAGGGILGGVLGSLLLPGVGTLAGASIGAGIGGGLASGTYSATQGDYLGMGLGFGGAALAGGLGAAAGAFSSSSGGLPGLNPYSTTAPGPSLPGW